ncbi:glycosyltransferase family 4 protein [Paenibacillus sp. EC2-1]|uniref:glycosyltransferase family 4 protein n=1 Tax=Paenibacillus sp. EC2-1 TaxID=3388665 RepID=UPI003BEF3C90
MKKVLLVHNYYQQGGGEDKVFAQEEALLRSNGIEVELYTVHNDLINNQTLMNKAKMALDATWSSTEYKRIKKKLMDMKPDVVHVHNFFPIISPSIYYACNHLNIPVVQTLHNYRLMCPAATFLRENKVCEKCMTGSLINSVINGCYRGSRVQTVPLVTMISLNRMLGTWGNKVNRYIALTEFSKRKFIEGGIPEDKITVKPNFISTNDNTESMRTINQNYLLYVGRISAEKGVRNLLEAWQHIKDQKNMKLLIVGEGPEKEQLSMLYAHKNVEFVGNQPSNKVLEYMKDAKYLIVPSIWYEGFPMTIVEAYSVGTPVICSQIGSLQEVVHNEVTGFHFVHDDIQDIQRVIGDAINYKDYYSMREKVIEVFQNNYTEEINYKLLEDIYRSVIKENNNGRTAKAKI